MRRSVRIGLWIGGLLAFLLLCAYLFMDLRWLFGENYQPILLGQYFTQPERLQEAVRSAGAWSWLLYLFIQIAQVIIAPVPGNVTSLAGGMLFGHIWGSVLGASGILVGSMLAFWIAKKWGVRLVRRLVSQKIYDRYIGVFSGRRIITIYILFLMPFIPDDALCFLAGLGSLPWQIFLGLVLLGRVPLALVTSYIGSGVLVLEPWQWVVAAVVAVIMIYVSYRYSDKMEVWMAKKLKLPQDTTIVDSIEKVKPD